MRHVASHSTETQLALIGLMLGGIFEFIQAQGRLPRSAELVGAGSLAASNGIMRQQRKATRPI